MTTTAGKLTSFPSSLLIPDIGPEHPFKRSRPASEGASTSGVDWPTPAYSVEKLFIGNSKVESSAVSTQLQAQVL
jgi:hypothetical protein